MKVLIIEDERLAAEKLERMILRYDSTIEIMQKIKAVEEAVEWLDEAQAVDLIFMDIHLLDGTCFDILKQCKLPCPVVFVTAFDHYALKAFELQSIDYLLKPVSYPKLEHAFHKYFEMKEAFQTTEQDTAFEQLLGNASQPKQDFKNRFLVKSASQIFSIPTKNVAYLYSEDKISFLVTWNNKRHMLTQSLGHVEPLLDPSKFFRINRKLIINIDCVEVIHTHFKGRLKVEINPEPNFEVLVSSRRVTDFKDWLDQ